MQSLNKIFEIIAKKVTTWAGSTSSSITAMLVMVFWSLGEFCFSFGTIYQLSINSITTCISFTMLFLIQRSLNKENEIIQLKLNELIAKNKDCDNKFINLEELSEDEIAVIRKNFDELAKNKANSSNPT